MSLCCSCCSSKKPNFLEVELAKVFNDSNAQSSDAATISQKQSNLNIQLSLPKRRNTKKSKSLLAAANKNPDAKSNLNESDSNIYSISRLVATLGPSFCGTTYADSEMFCNWAVGPEYKDALPDKVMGLKQNQSENHSDGSDNTYEMLPLPISLQEERIELMRTFMSFACALNGAYPREGCCIGSRILEEQQIDSQVKDFQGLFDGVLVIRYYPNGYQSDGFLRSELCWPMTHVFTDPQMKRSISSSNSTVRKSHPWTKNEKTLMARLNLILGIFTSWKKEFLKSTPYIYVALNAVHPDSQGKCVCSKQMRTLNTLADLHDITLWLEAGGTKNIGIYKKLGYEVVRKLNDEKTVQENGGRLRLKTDPEDWYIDGEMYVGMLRRKKSERRDVIIESEVTEVKKQGPGDSDGDLMEIKLDMKEIT